MAESSSPRTSEVASRLGVEDYELRALIHEHGLRVDKDKSGRYFQWTDEVIAAAKALLQELVSRQPEPPPPGLTSKQVAARLKIKYASFCPLSLEVRKREPSVQPVTYQGTLYWREDDVAILEKALAEHRSQPELRQKYLIEAQHTRLAELREHARALRDGRGKKASPQAERARHHVKEILTLCQKIEETLAVPLTSISTLPVKGWSLRQPVFAWVSPVFGGFEAAVVDFDLRIFATTREGAIKSLRHAICRRYQELAQAPAQNAAAWAAFRQLVVPPAGKTRRALPSFFS